MKIIRTFRRAIRSGINDLQFFSYGISPRLRKYDLALCAPNDIGKATLILPNRVGGCIVAGCQIDRKRYPNTTNGFVIDGDWDEQTTPIENLGIFDRSIRRFIDGKSWEEVGEIDWMMANIEAHGVQDNCRVRDDVDERCRKLDIIKESAERTGKLLSQRELGGEWFREKGGIGIAVGRNGCLIWFDNGGHRLAIAQYVGLKEIPVCVLLVHKLAVKNRLVFKNLRVQESR